MRLNYQELGPNLAADAQKQLAPYISVSTSHVFNA